MSAVERLLDTFNQRELAFFWRYKLPTYLPATQERIQAYMAGRELTESSATWMSDQPTVIVPGNCVRCGSQKIQEQKIAKWNTGEKEGLGLLVTGSTSTGSYKECMVCGHVVDDPNEGPTEETLAVPTLLTMILNSWRRRRG